MAQFLRPQNDAVFKMLFSKSENSDLLIGFLTAVLTPPVPIESVYIVNPEIPKDAISDKSIVLDVVAKLKNGQLIDIEMQVSNRAGFRSRVLFYLCRLHQSQLEVAEEYSKIKPSVSIVILGYKETEEEKYHSVYEMKEQDSHIRFSHDLSIHLIELPKLNTFLKNHPKDRNELLALWSRFFNANSNLEVKELAMENPIFQKAEAALNIIMGNPEAQELARMRDKGRMMYQLDVAANREDGKAEGRAEGRAEGKAEGRAEGMAEGEVKGRTEGQIEGEIRERKNSVFKMHAKGLPPEQIAAMLDLDIAFVQETIANP